MLRVFNVQNNKEKEIFSVNKIFNVLELGEYKIEYSTKSIESEIIFIEDIAIDKKNIVFNENTIILSKSKYFEDYFGYSSLTINNEIFLFNIKIEKLKISEIEDIFTYLWEKEDKIFNVFFSKSTYNIDFKKDGSVLSQTSKFLSFIDIYIRSFDKLFFLFKNLPHTILRQKKEVTKYQAEKITPETINWLFSNLDEIVFDNSLKGFPDTIEINNKIGIVDNIEVANYYNSFDNYENQIILGSFQLILDKIRRLKKQISSNIDIKSENKDLYYADFKDLKKVQFLKLFNDSSLLEKKIIKLEKKYSNLFKDVHPNIGKPKLTSVFTKKLHYKKSYELIKKIRTKNFDLSGEFKLLNISKLSKLYEVYNLYIIIETINNTLNLDYFKSDEYSNRSDEIIECKCFYNDLYKISIFYEHKYYTNNNEKNKTDLVRIYDPKNNNNYYNPDFILEIENKITSEKKYYILDSKYSKIETVKSNYLNDTVFKYILNTGIKNEPNKKVNSLHLLTPSDYEYNLISSSFFEPIIGVIPSKPRKENDLNNLIIEILEKNIENKFLKTRYPS